MKLKNIFNLVKNSKNHQYNFNLKIKQLKKLGLTPEELLEMSISKPLVKKILGDIK